MNGLALLMYVPALHQSYLKFFEKYAGPDQNDLYIMGNDIVEHFPMTFRELRRVEPDLIATMVRSLNLFRSVEVLCLADICRLKKRSVIMTSEYISDGVKESYLSGVEVLQDFSFFLRYDEKSVEQAYGVPEFDCQVTSDDLYRTVMGSLRNFADQKSSDWFRRVGCALIIDDRLILPSHNKRLPSAHDPWLVGDPRNFIPYGSLTQLVTTLHAEKVLISQAARKGIATEGASMAITVYPCPDCAEAVAEAGIKRLYFQGGVQALNTRDVFQVYGVEIVRVS